MTDQSRFDSTQLDSLISRAGIRQPSCSSACPATGVKRVIASGALKLFAVAMLVSLIGCPSGARAADNDIQLWPSATISHGFGENFGAHFMARGRFDDDVSETKDYLLRPFVSWLPTKSVTLDLGYDYLHSFTSASENRIWQAGQHSITWHDLIASNRIRLDQRFIENVDGVVVRFRYRFRATHPLWSSWLYGVISDEVFTNVNDQGAGPIAGFEQNRLRFALDVRFKKRLRVESGYEYQYVKSRDGAETNTHTFIIEFSLSTNSEPLFHWDPR